MRKIYSFFLLVLISAFSLSCSSLVDYDGDLLLGVNQNGGSGGNGGSGSGGGSSMTGKVLVKMTSHTLNDAGQFEDATVTFNYVNNRFVSYTDEAGNGLNIEYNSSNKISRISAPGAVNSVFTYNGNVLSKVTSDITGFGNLETSYTFNGANLAKTVIISTVSLFSVSIKSYLEDNYETTANNITKDVTKIGLYDPTTGDLIISPDAATSSYGYDAKFAPFSLLPKEFSLYFSSLSPQTGYINSLNNPVNQTVTDQANGTATATITYEYDTDNYATKASSSDGEYYIYQYKKL
ncbi:hypothetical protein [Halpernia frigidisoli]|uniref:YD repeat-containing protein n=1 Tax=Halpernia frigidisoli TaxID=1125876 RepID=A0A1I3GN66_9FLAO|nr:hypothetical protein [Halpernia frigidisoli]SFI24856.1 hypothetical protein SAMN05443292_1934 [Halpernia frigidisoli]